MKILGLHSAIEWEGNSPDMMSRIHDSGASLFVDGEHIRSIDESRCNRNKHEGNYPKNAIDYCLDGICNKEDIDIVAYSPTAVHLCNKDTASGDVGRYLKYRFPNAQIWFVGHHLCHAASTVFTAPFNSGSFFTLDGMGSVRWDFADSSTKGYENNSIGYFDKAKRIFKSHTLNSGPGENSFGDFYMEMAVQIYNLKKTVLKEKGKGDKLIYHYNTIEDYQDVMEFSPEGKVMGLSAYGSVPKDVPAPYTFSKEFPLTTMDIDKYDFQQPWINFYDYSKIFKALDGHTADDIAAYTQKHFEDAIVKYVTALREEYLEEDTCLAGGCFLNVCANSLLKPLFNNLHIPPYPNDSGVHFGAAAWAAYRCQETIVLPTNLALLGKSYDDYVPEGADHYEDFDMLCEVVARLIDENKIIGWFQGRSEHGPRALGSRSILMSPSRKDNKDIINSRVKHREYWRPFAGVTLEDRGYDSPYMLYAQDVLTDDIPAITHEDNTCRMQTVNDELNPKLCTLLRKFENPVLLNTSFNDNGEPIVETPEDAIKAFDKMDLDYLVINNYILCK
tara:strand:+ start:2055 stop:3734 length:1680 start_codon:yes stop_codon:yes gene_type:complete